MAYLVTCTFDLKNASTTDYQNAYSDLAKIGLKKAITGSSGQPTVAPTTMTIGEFNGQSASAVCTAIRDQVQAAFTARRFKSEIFIVVGDNWAWVPATT